VTSHVVNLKCNGHDHSVTTVADPVAFLKRMCKFWRPIFGLDGVSCTEADLAVLQQTSSEEAVSETDVTGSQNMPD